MHDSASKHRVDIQTNLKIFYMLKKLNMYYIHMLKTESEFLIKNILAQNLFTKGN